MADNDEWNCVVTRKSTKKKSKLHEKVLDEKEQVQYLLKNYKVNLCRKSLRDHDVKTCVKAHEEKELRRYPFRDDQGTILRYSKIMCPKIKDGYCTHGNECLDSHNEAEQHFHPAIYKTVLCNRKPCHMHFCYFAHNQEQLRHVQKNFLEVKKERTISFSDFIAAVPKVSTDEKKLEIEVIHEWTGWQKKIGSSELLPCPLEDVFSRMLSKYPDVQAHVRELCLHEGCTPYMEMFQRTSRSPVLLMISGITKDAICTATLSVQEYLQQCRPKSEGKFPGRFLQYVYTDSKGISFLKNLCLKNKGIDVSVDQLSGVIVVWGGTQNKRQFIQLELKKICTGFALTDAQAIADARLRSLEMELRRTQQQLQDALEENYRLSKTLKSTELLVNKMCDESNVGVKKKPETRTLPPFWESTDGYQEFKVESKSDEWENVKTSFLATIGSAYRYNIRAITRIENHELWEHYVLLNKKISNEKELWHGSAQKSLLAICQKGYDRSYAGMHAIAYGRGTYFARDSSYSVSYSSRDSLGDRYMILTKVLVGRYTQGDRTMDFLPAEYDSAVNRPMDPSIYVVFKDFQAYPAYIVKFQ